jgi:hypothetical protein
VTDLDYYKKKCKAGDRGAAYIALGLCRRAKKTIPMWVLDAIEIDGLERYVQDWKKKVETPRYRQAQQDRSVYLTVLDFRAQGLTWDKSYEKAARIVGTWDGTELNAERAKNAYIRVRRLEKSGKLV